MTSYDRLFSVLSSCSTLSNPLLSDLESKVHVLPTTDLSLPNLGLNTPVLSDLRKLTHIIHAAWPVNFNLPLPSFTPHIAAVQNLINISLSVSALKPARFIFCSSISVAGNAPAGTAVKEGLVHGPRWAQNTGYARSKFVAEHVVAKAAEAGADVQIMRIGQLVGDTEMGKWKMEEAVPGLVRSIAVLGCMPALDEVGVLMVCIILTSCSKSYSIRHGYPLTSQRPRSSSSAVFSPYLSPSGSDQKRHSSTSSSSSTTSFLPDASPGSTTFCPLSARRVCRSIQSHLKNG